MVLGKVIRGTIIIYYLNFVGRYQLDDSFWYLLQLVIPFREKHISGNFSASPIWRKARIKWPRASNERLKFSMSICYFDYTNS